MKNIMKKITNLQNKFNNTTNEKNKPTKKTFFKIRKDHFLKDFSNLTFNPRFHHTYKLNKKYRNLQIGSRVTIATLATTLGVGIGATVFTHISTNNDNEIETTYETNNEILNRSEVLDNAKSTLANTIFPEGSIYHESAYISFPSRDEHREINSVQVSMSREYIDTPEYRYISGHEVNEQNPEIVNEFLEKIVKVAGTEEPSQKDLQELQELSDTISKMNLRLVGENIVDLEENDFERD